MKATPSPAITACLIVSFESISVPGSSSRPGISPRKRSNELRVPDPGSRMMKCSRATSSRLMPRRPTSGWSGAATTNSGWSPKAAARTGTSRGGDPISATSMRWSFRLMIVCARLPTKSFMSTSGYSRMKPATSCGAKYLAVETAPTIEAASPRSPDRVDLVPEHAQPLLDRLRRIDHRESGGRRPHALGGAVEQDHAGVLFQLLELQRDGRRGEA